MGLALKFPPFSSLLTSNNHNILVSNRILQGYSGSIYLAFLLLTLITLVTKNLHKNSNEAPKQMLMSKNSHSFHKQTFFCCVFLLLINLFTCFLNLFYSNNNESIITVQDTLIGTFVWLFISVYVHTQVSNSGNNMYPFLLRVWWACFSSISCFCFVVDCVYYKQDLISLQFVVFDALCAIISLFLCYVEWFSVKNEGEVINTLYQESNTTDETISPSTTTNIFSSLTFSWIHPLIAKGYTKQLNLEDVQELESIDRAERAFSVLRTKLESYKRNNIEITSFNLAMAVFWTTWKDIIITGLLSVVFTLASYVGPFLIDTFVVYLNGRRKLSESFLIVSAFFVAKITEFVTKSHRDFKLKEIGSRSQAALVAVIYHKGLTFSTQSKQGRSNGDIINLMAVDAERIGEFSKYMHNTWLLVLQVGLALAILYKDLGFSSLAAFVATVMLLLVNIPIGRFQGKFQKKLMEFKDKRMKITSETLKNMRILKLYGWEMKFLSRIENIRNEEAHWLYKYSLSLTISAFAFWVTPIFVAITTFGTCMVFGVPLESGKVLSALATFKILQESMYGIPEAISMIAQTKVSIDRIASFLRLYDLDSNLVETGPQGSSNTAVEIINGSLSWDLTFSKPTLTDVNLRVSHGTRVAVCGTVGSGKSSLLSCILGEIPKVSGKVKVCGTKAYVGQLPWIQSGKIEENILFGKEMDRQRYEKVVEACDLKKDFDLLAFGDQTIIGERGINLSGGQKQRVQIARALYQDADIYLFDDPFSAVDAHTGSHLFKECILRFLKSKTVIYVTHQVEFLPAADLILVLKDGRITQAGKYLNILKSESDFTEIVGAHKKALSEIESVGKNLHFDIMDDNKNQKGPKTIKKNISNNDKNNNRQLVEEEEREKGSVGMAVYLKYITIAYKGALAPLILLSQILFEVLQISSNYWMGRASFVSQNNVFITVYVAFGIGSCLCILARVVLLMKFVYVTANELFYKMHLCIFRAPMSFFDANPSGRILSRASTDQSAVELKVPYVIGPFGFMVIQLLGVIAVMSIGAWPVFIVYFPVIGICIRLQQYYLPSARELARLVGVCKAPIIQHFSETISGSTTIRSFDQKNRFEDTCMKLIDNYSRPKLHAASVLEWLGLRLDLLSSIIFIFTLIFLVSIPEGTINPSTAGLAVIYGLSLNKLQGSVIKTYANMEITFISVERLFQYSSIPSEPPLIIDSNRPDLLWPSQGKVDIYNLQVRYGPHMPLVLRGITCTFLGGTKTGIVGRTGSGKSTLVQTLFRIVEPTCGEIMIDGINLSSIGLHDLRSRLSIIPQDPTMFSGTVRSNMDPLEDYTDDQIWEALDKCQIGDEVRETEGQLDSTVTENGENWSMGQRQLVCLGRVLLKKSKILVLDEATASVDTATDNMIQKTLRQHFSDSTVITIAHRITSVVNSDMVLVLNNGLIEEYDSPTKLLEDKSTSFSKLVAEYNMRSDTNHISTQH